MVILMMIKQTPQNWFREVEKFVVSSHKNSFYLNRVYQALLNEYRLGFVGEKNREELKRLTAMVLAKHEIGVKHPNLKLVEQSIRVVEKHLGNPAPHQASDDPSASAPKS